MESARDRAVGILSGRKVRMCEEAGIRFAGRDDYIISKADLEYLTEDERKWFEIYLIRMRERKGDKG